MAPILVAEYFLALFVRFKFCCSSGLFQVAGAAWKVLCLKLCCELYILYEMDAACIIEVLIRRRLSKHEINLLQHFLLFSTKKIDILFI